MQKYQINILANGGYAADQVKGMKVSELIELLEDLNPNDEIITYDTGNELGASYGRILNEIDVCEDYCEYEHVFTQGEEVCNHCGKP